MANSSKHVKPKGKRGQGKRQAKSRQREESVDKAEALNVPRSMSDDDDAGGRGTRRNIAIIRTVNDRRGSLRIPEAMKEQLVDYQLQYALKQDGDPYLASLAFNSLLKGEATEQREEEIRLRREELTLKRQMILQDRIGEEVSGTGPSIIPDRDDLIAGVTRLLAAGDDGEGTEQPGDAARPTLVVPLEGDGDARRVAEEVA